MSGRRKQGSLSLPPWARTKGLGTNAKSEIDRWIREDEVLKLLAAARTSKDRWARLAYDSFVILANLGLRVGELVQLQASDFDSLLSHNAINVRTLKKRRSQPVRKDLVMRMTPEDLAQFQAQANQRVASRAVVHTIYVGNAEKKGISDVLEERIEEARKDRDQRLFPNSKRYIQYLFNYYRDRAGLRVGLSPHALRRFVATRIATITGDPRLAKKRLRHSEDVTMEHYVQYPPEQQIKLLGRMRPML